MLLILSNRDTEDRQQMITACLQNDVEYSAMEGWKVPASLKDRTDLRLYAEPLFADTMAAQLGLALLEAPLDWLVSCPARFTRRQINLSTLAAARHITRSVFVKALDDKQIRPQIYANGLELPRPGLADDSLPVLVAEPVVWELEVRLFVLNGQIMAGSTYLSHNNPTYLPLAETSLENEIRLFTEEVFAVVGQTLPRATVIDVGRDPSGHWSIVELNAAWGSGTYACDPSGVLKVILEASLAAESATSVPPAFIRQLPDVEWKT